MAKVTVRVMPRSGRSRVELGAEILVIRVRAAPEGGRATEEARRVLAEALHVAPTRVRLVSGARARTKVFEIEGLTPDDLEVRLGAT
jgi:hypothetical protein